jgi:hypothetical protein
MQSTMTKTQGLAAFKEWAVSCKALGEGKQVMLFRKGGIKEKDHVFKVEHPHFFLFPTYEHQDPESIKPDYQGLLQASLGEKPEIGELTLRYWARVDEAVPMTSMEPVLRQQGNHIFSESCIRYRWEWQSSKPLWLLLLRVHELENPQTIEVLEDYTGCKSWVDFQPTTLLQLPCKPVLDDAAYEAMASKVKSLF